MRIIMCRIEHNTELNYVHLYAHIYMNVCHKYKVKVGRQLERNKREREREKKERENQPFFILGKILIYRTKVE